MSNEEFPEVDHLETLKARADLMGIKYHPSIGAVALQEKIDAALVDEPEKEEEEEQSEVTQRVETEDERRRRQIAYATELIRVRVTCMNPAKSEWEGELFTAANAVVGTHKKFVPFNNDSGWHVPRIILNMMEERQCQIFHTVTDRQGNKTRQGKLIKEFAIEILPNLTKEELKDLAQRQAASHAIA